MYYSPSSGYYYDMERNLLYEPYSQCYYWYNTETTNYELYYQAAATGNDANTIDADQVTQQVNGLKLDDSPVSKSKNKPCKENEPYTKKKSVRLRMIPRKKIEAGKRSTDVNSNERDIKSSSSVKKTTIIDTSLAYSSPEEGEIFSSSSSASEASDEEPPPYTTIVQDYEPSSKELPPCIRAIIKQSSDQTVGSLLLIPSTGGVIGRLKNNAVYIPDISVSKTHAKVTFDKELWMYYIADLGSQNGTYINNTKLSQNFDENSSSSLKHGDILTLGSCKMLIHIHAGDDTCHECEPGLIQAEIPTNQETSSSKNKVDKEKERKQQLKQMKKKFGLKEMDFVNGEIMSFSNNQTFKDRAEIRRRTVGSQNPYEKDAPGATIESALPATNKGYQMLKNMGWKDGQSLGVTEAGAVEPIMLQPWSGKAGFGCENVHPEPVLKNMRQNKWVKAQQRYSALDESVSKVTNITSIFDEDDE